MKYTKDGEWPFETQYCPACGSGDIECDGIEVVDDFHCRKCGALFDCSINYDFEDDQDDKNE